MKNDLKYWNYSLYDDELTYIRLPKTASTSMTKWLSKNKFDYNILGFRGMCEKTKKH